MGKEWMQKLLKAARPFQANQQYPTTRVHRSEARTTADMQHVAREKATLTSCRIVGRSAPMRWGMGLDFWSDFASPGS